MDTPATIRNLKQFDTRFDDRMQKHIDFCMQYERFWDHGAPGHLDMLTISRLATSLFEVLGTVRELQSNLFRLNAASSDELREALAAYAHDEAWSGWMEYLFSKSAQNPDGSVTIPGGLVARWKRQMTTAYADLPENEKDSDRKEADRMIAIVQEAAHAQR